MADELNNAVTEPTSFQFHTHEHTTLRHEILERIRSGHRLQVEVAVALGVYYYFLQAIKLEFFGKFGELLSYWLPFTLVHAANIRDSGNRRQIMRLGIYIRLIEDRYADPTVGGWENYRDKNLPVRTLPLIGTIKRPIFFWLYVYILTLSVAIYLTLLLFGFDIRIESLLIRTG